MEKNYLLHKVKPTFVGSGEVARAPLIVMVKVVPAFGSISGSLSGKIETVLLVPLKQTKNELF